MSAALLCLPRRRLRWTTAAIRRGIVAKVIPPMNPNEPPENSRMYIHNNIFFHFKRDFPVRASCCAERSLVG